MTTARTGFDPARLLAPPDIRPLGPWRVESMAFDPPAEVPPAAPVVLLGGAFQNYRSFRTEARHLARTRPVRLVHLPGQGANTQDAAELDLDDLADLLAAWCEAEGLGPVVVIGLSYGGGIAHRFAVRHPGLLHSVVVGGAACALPEELCERLYATRAMPAGADLERWAGTVALGLINWSAAAETGFTGARLSTLTASLCALDAAAHRRWWDNTARLLGTRLGSGLPSGSLVFGAEHDSLLPPWLAGDLAACSPAAQFALVLGVDHLAPLQRPERLLALYDAHLNGTLLADPPHGVLVGAAAYEAVGSRRARESLDVADLPVRWHSPDGRRGVLQALRVGPHGLRGQVAGARPQGPVHLALPGLGRWLPACALRVGPADIEVGFLPSRPDEAELAASWFRGVAVPRAYAAAAGGAP